MNAYLHALLKRKVFANVLMGVFLAGGLLSAMNIRQELLPDREARRVQVTVELRGASPAEVSTSILGPIENAVRGLDGIKRVDAQAREGVGTVDITLLENAASQEMVNDIKNAIDRIAIFPKDAEKPTVSLPVETERALSIIVYGDQPLLWLRETAEQVRDDLRTLVGLTKVQLAFPREKEISVEISEKTLRQYGWTLEEAAGIIHDSSLDLPGGTIHSPRVDIALRTTERRQWAHAFADVVIATTDAGIPLRLSDVAVLKEGFGDATIESWFDGKPAIQIDVFAVGKETPMSVEAAVQNYIDNLASEKFKGVDIVIFENEAAAYRSRLWLLLENAAIGLALVLVVLGLFLTPQLAFWVMAGIPTSLLGGLLILPLFDVSINMLSLFAFIVTIGVVVDDAIMVAEAIHTHRRRGLDPLAAAAAGLKEMGGPVMLATTTTIIAFLPAFFVPGEMGTLFRQIPAVVVSVLLVSLVEALFILTVHLARPHRERPWMAKLARPNVWVNQRMERFVKGRFRTFVTWLLAHPGIVMASMCSLLFITVGGLTGGLLGFSFTPTIESDTVIAQATLPYGSPRHRSVAVQKALVDAANEVIREHRIDSSGVFALIGTRLEEGEVEIETLAGSHYISVLVALPPNESRSMTGRAFAHAWQTAFGDPGGLEALNFTGETNVTGGEPIRLELFHPIPSMARKAALYLGKRLRDVPGLSSIDDGIRTGKPELVLRLKESGLHMGITAEELARQVRHRFHGVEILRFVRGSSEIKVRVRLCETERRNTGALREVLLKSPSDAMVPLTEVADISPTQVFTTLARRDGRRIYPVTADIGFGFSDDGVEDLLEETIVPRMIAKYPGLSVTFGGEEEEIDASLASLGNGFLIVLGVMFMVFAFYFNNYTQPLLVLSVVPFSLIGAVWGHILFDVDLSIISVIGIIAMAGVVVNDSLVLATAYNLCRAAGRDHRQAVVDAACHRFRPILLTSLTTFCGLMPLMLERSEQAQFLIPAAISISFGLVFGTIVTLVFVPSLLGLLSGRLSG